MVWGYVAGAAASAILPSLLGTNKSGGSGQSGGPQYTPGNPAGVDNSWQQMYNQQNQLANQTNQQTAPYFGQSLAQGESLNYQPYLQSAQQAGGMYGQVGQAAQGQMAGYGQQAQTALGQQSQMYGAGNQIMNTAFDPQNALYERTQQQVQDQTRAGQAARGLGNSALGGMEEGSAMSNFNIDWQNAQLARQAQGISSGVAANQAGVQQGNLYGQNQQAALGAGNMAATAYGMQGQVPMQAQQYAAAQPGAIASAYQNAMIGQQGMNTNAMNGAQSYMGLSQSGGQANYDAALAQNQSAGNFYNTLGTKAYEQYGQGLFNSQPVAQSPYSSYTGANTQGYTTGSDYNWLG